MKLPFGKHKGEQLEECPETYILWLAQHERVLALRNRKFAKEAKRLMKKEYEVGQVVRIVTALFGGVTIATITEVTPDSIYANLDGVGPSFMYTRNDIAPATQEDIANRRAFAASLKGKQTQQPVAGALTMPATDDWFRLDEDGVLIA
jgi:hypothetical protein